jgi:hypothetical protein
MRKRIAVAKCPNTNWEQVKLVWGRRCHRAIILVYVIVACLLVKWFADVMFYTHVSEDTWHLYRFFWCYSVTLLAGAIGLWMRCDGYGSTVLYLLYYPSLLAAIASLVFVFAQASTTMSGYLFYYFTAALCFILGATVEYFLNTASAVLSSLLKLGSRA